MMNVVATEVGTPVHSGIRTAPAKSGRLIWACIIVCLFAGLLALWHYFDHSIPAPDDSSYILGSFQYADLLRHPKFWSPHWLHSMLTVNQVYPPTAMVFNGALRLLFGFGNWVNVLSVVLFDALLTATVYGTTRLLTGNGRAALLAAVLINLYPQISCMNHGFALDAPLMAMIAAGTFILFWWRESPSWSRTLICGLVLGLACLTKQIAAAYLIGPGLYCLVDSIRSDVRERRWLKSRRLIAAATLTFLCGLPWTLTNLEHIRFLAQDNQAVMGPIMVWQVFPRDLVFYARSFPDIMSPLLLAAFAVALLLAGKTVHRQLLPLSLSAVGGVLAISTLTWALPSFRYDAPVLIATAAYTGFLMSRLLDRWLPAVIVCTVIALATIQFVSFNFAPYPISQPRFVSHISEMLGVKLVETVGLTERDRREAQILHSTPAPPEDWGQEWAIRTIDRFEGRKPVYLNILPDYVQLNGNTFELLGRMLGSPVRPTTSRRWTVIGDCVKFSPEVAMYYQWYLLKSGYQGNILRDDESEKSYSQLIDFVEHGGKFKLIDSHKLPDGSTMFLYRQK